jgi:hypothetical protein
MASTDLFSPPYASGSGSSQDGNIFKKLKESFATGSPLLPSGSASGSVIGSNKWNLFAPSQQPSWFEHFGLQVWQRWAFASAFFMLGIFFMFMSFMFLAQAMFYPGSFAFVYCSSTLCFILSVGFVRGMKTHLLSFFARKTAVFSGTFLVLTVATLYTAIQSGRWIFMAPLMLAQMASFVFFVATFIPGGTKGVTSMSRVAFSSFVGRF